MIVTAGYLVAGMLQLDTAEGPDLETAIAALPEHAGWRVWVMSYPQEVVD